MSVEAAVTMPLTVFLVLGVLQLAAVQQARLMTEYAAFQAARAGIVWNGNAERMHDAALWALLPTLGRTDGMEALGRTWTAGRALDGVLQDALLPPAGGGAREPFRDARLLGMVRVDTLGPAGWAQLGSLWNVRGGADWKELDFDGPDTLVESPELDRHVDRFLDPRKEDAGQAFYRRATVLTLRLRYLYELKIPFANWVLFTSWFATNAGRALSGGIDRPTLGRGTAVGSGGSLDPLAGGARGIGARKGLPPVTPDEMERLWRLSKGEGRLGPSRRFFLPLLATCSLRMQSAFHRKWLMHDAPGWEP
ncbi:MAG TPA: TadE family protein [Longimicrobium sp.]|nr:TadE family protein [Longimicrobium sp.]